MYYQYYFFILSLLVKLISTSSQNGVGPFEVIIKKMENCEETGLKKIDVVYANLTRTGVETYNYAGKIITTIDFGDNVDGKMDVTVIKNGQHLDHYYIHEFSSSCKEMKKYFSDSFDAFLEASGMEDCPFPAGVYEMKNKMKISIDPTVIPALPYGPYIGRGYMYENDELVGCIKYTADVVPKQTGKKRKQG